ncbi:MAG: winged helix-turn-helix domain-containing protein [Steroidobacteraceae bacterium]
MCVPAVRFRVEMGAEAVGPGKISLLERIACSGSLSQAARDLGMSYRRAWQLMASLNSTFTAPVVLTTRGGRGGGGAALTPLGERLIRAYRALDADIQVRARRRFRPLARAARDAARPLRPRAAVR